MFDFIFLKLGKLHKVLDDFKMYLENSLNIFIFIFLFVFHIKYLEGWAEKSVKQSKDTKMT